MVNWFKEQFCNPTCTSTNFCAINLFNKKNPKILCGSSYFPCQLKLQCYVRLGQDLHSAGILPSVDK